MIRVGILQLSIAWEDKKKNIEKLEAYCKRAKESQVELLLLPEMSFTGFSMNTLHTVDSADDIIEKLVCVAKNYNMYIGFGWVGKSTSLSMEGTRTLCNNHYTIVNPHGVVSDYSKIHPFSFSEEDKFFEGGKSLTQFFIKEVPFSNFICYDLRFPEVFQIISPNVHIIIVPACWPHKRSEHWKCLLRARAIENQCYIIGVNCVGNVGGLEYSGNSRIINPNGDVVAQAEEGAEELVIFDLNDDVDSYRNSFPVKNDRREGLYEELRHECNG